MNPIPAPTHPREEWPDADFDLPEGHSIHESIEKTDNDDDDEDWDLDLHLGKAAGARAQASSDASASSEPQMHIARPIASSSDADDDEGMSTIKAGGQSTVRPTPKSPLVEDFEDGFSLPSDLTQLSLAPVSRNHLSTKNSLEWGDKDQTSSSQSSDAYSTLGLADASSSSNSNSSASYPGTETEEDDDDEEDDVEGLIFPSDIFDSGEGTHRLTTMLAMKRDTVTDDRVKVASPDDDFEMGLVIDDDADFSPSRLLKSQVPHIRSHSMPVQRHVSATRPQSRLKHDRGQSAIHSSTRHLKARITPSPPLTGPIRTRSPCPSPTPSSSSFLAAKSGSSNLRGQKSHSGLHPSTPPPNSSKKISRKASLSSLMDTSPTASGSGLDSESSSSKSRYEESTAASRAKSYKSMGRIMHDWVVPPTRPSTPSNSTAALRLTMPTGGRFKSRPALASVFSSPSSSSAPQSPAYRTASPQPTSRPSSRVARLSRTLPTHIPPAAPAPAPPPAPRVLRRPKRQRAYGDGTELDGIDDLPTDRDQESRFRVQPKGYGNRIPGGSFSSKPGDKNTIRRKSSRRERSESSSIKRSSKFDVAYLKFSANTSPPRKKKNLGSPVQSRKKPVLIRNLGGVGSPKGTWRYDIMLVIGSSLSRTVVGDMKWNPYTLRWEGNDQALRDFDAVVTSTRPALITHLTGSSIGSPVGPSFATGARRVGNMIFDPARLCWISTLPPDEDEPDVFANLADDEEDVEGWDAKGDTIRGVGDSSSCAPSPARSSHTRASSECSDRGSRASLVCDVDEQFAQRCRLAEERHRIEMKGWKSTLSKQDVFTDPDRSFLFTLRDYAMAATRRT
ncbi:hypothetical protein BDZ89DRAFT_472806 [Hymenopellis radicata]|nr:hypothetical protein BDZ89DRAFT_472806 [Hymenopellis radicata]